MWIAFDVLFLVIGVVCAFYGWKAGQVMEAYGAILPFLGGLALILIVIFSELIRVAVQ